MATVTVVRNEPEPQPEPKRRMRMVRRDRSLSPNVHSEGVNCADWGCVVDPNYTPEPPQPPTEPTLTLTATLTLEEAARFRATAYGHLDVFLLAALTKPLASHGDVIDRALELYTRGY